MLHPLAPGHLGHVDQPLHARLQLDERAVVGEAHHLARHARTHRVAVRHRRPRVGAQLLVAQRHALGRRVVLQHDHVDLVVDLEQLRRVADAAPRHVGDVQQAVDAAEVDEGAVVGDVLHHAAQHLGLRERLERVLLLLGVLLLEEDLARQHDVPALLVHLDDAHPQFLAAQGIQVPHGAHVHLRSGQERADADVHRQAALDPLDDPPDDHLPVGKRLLDVVPNLHLLRFFAGENDVAVPVLGALQEDVHGVPGLDRDLAVLVHEFLDADDPLGLVADVHDHLGVGDLQDRALDHFAFRDVAEAAVVEIEKLGVLRRVGVELVTGVPTGPGGRCRLTSFVLGLRVGRPALGCQFRYCWRC